MTWMKSPIFLTLFSQSAIALDKFSAVSSDKFLASESSAALAEDSSPKKKPHASHQVLPQVNVGITVPEEAQKCFTNVIFGKSPGSNLGNSTETSVDDCMSKCAAMDGCLAMTFRLDDGLCNLLDRTFEGKYEKTDERVVANKLDGCGVSQEAQVLPQVSKKTQRCFTELVFGKSPGSNMGNTTESSVDDCMSKCAAQEGCLAMTFRMSDGLCNLLDRTYDGKYEETDERVVANKLDSCEASQEVQVLPKVSKEAKKCFTKIVFGKSPGSNMGNSTETSVDDCMLKCEALEGCLAMTFRMSDGLCNFLNRTYDGKYEESNERLLANKIDSCASSEKVQVFEEAEVSIKVSEKAQKCFTNVIFGRSPGSNVGNSTESSVDDCMLKCAAQEGCLAMTFRLNDGLCNLLDRSYEGKYEASNERLLANRLEDCGGAASGKSVAQKVFEIFAFPFKAIGWLFSSLANIF